jgi:hypothetical protein
MSDPIIRFPFRQILALAVAPKYSAGFHSGASARFHIGGGITDQQTIFRAHAERF